ncbi:MAG TPA: hypothetical protein VF250_03375 [Conexibacter sp.]
MGDGVHTGERLRSRERPRTRQATVAEAVWLALVPAVLVTVGAVALLGPPLGRLLPRGGDIPWPTMAGEFRPEPTEHARYLLVMLLPLLVVGSIVLAGALRPRIPGWLARLAAAVPALGALLIVVCVVLQYRARVGGIYTAIAGTSARTVYFTERTLAVAAALGVALVLLARSDAGRRLADAVRDTPGRRIAAWAVAGAAVALSLLPAIEFESTLLRANVNTWYHLLLTFDEASAVLDGRSPLVDFAAQYGSLWPYPLAAAMSVLGESIGVFTLLTTLVASGALLSLFALLRRLTANATLALALFLPLLATSLYKMNGSLENRFSLATVTAIFPLRLAGPLLLLWMTVRHLDGARPHARWVLLFAAGLVVMNNVEFGVPALAATLAALLWTPRSIRPAPPRLAAELLLGLAAALALVAAVTLVRTGSPPKPELAVRFAQLYGNSGYGMFPLVPTIGVSTIVLMTFVAAVGVATARVVERAPDPPLASALAWSGVFGLGSGTYYVGRSHPEVLINMFPMWALCLVLLTIVVLREVRGSGRLPGPAGFACAVGFGVLVCSLAQTPTPWSQVRRLSETTPDRVISARAVRFVERHTRPGEPVVILTPTGHNLAVRAGVTDVAPYTGSDLMPARQQLDDTLEALRKERGTRVFADVTDPPPEILPAIEAAGFRLAATDRVTGLAVLVAP